jgi:hypothetical protein
MARAPDGSTPIEKHRFKEIAELFIISIGKRGVGGRGGVRLIHRTENRALVLFLENGTAPFEKCKQCWNCNISFYLETPGGPNSNVYLNVVHFFNNSVN